MQSTTTRKRWLREIAISVKTKVKNNGRTLRPQSTEQNSPVLLKCRRFDACLVPKGYRRGALAHLDIPTSSVVRVVRYTKPSPRYDDDIRQRRVCFDLPEGGEVWNFRVPIPNEARGSVGCVLQSRKSEF
jgi:hypothetical protein